MDPADFMLRKKQSQFMTQLEGCLSKYLYGNQPTDNDKKEITNLTSHVNDKNKTTGAVTKDGERLLELHFLGCVISRTDVEEMDSRVLNHLEDDNEFLQQQQQEQQQPSQKEDGDDDDEKEGGGGGKKKAMKIPKQKLFMSFGQCSFKSTSALKAMMIFCKHYTIYRLNLSGSYFVMEEMALFVEAAKPECLELSIPQPSEENRGTVKGILKMILSKCSKQHTRELKLNARVERDDDDYNNDHDDHDDDNKVKAKDEGIDNIEKDDEINETDINGNNFTRGVVSQECLSELVSAMDGPISKLEAFALTDCAITEQGMSLLVKGLVSIKKTLEHLDLQFEMASPTQETNPISAALRSFAGMVVSAATTAANVAAHAATQVMAHEENNNDNNNNNNKEDMTKHHSANSSVLLQVLGDLMRDLPHLVYFNLDISHWPNLFFVPAQQVPDDEGDGGEMNTSPTDAHDKKTATTAAATSSSSTKTTVEMVRQFAQAFQKFHCKTIRLQLRQVGLTEDSALRILAAAAQNHFISESGGTGGAGITLELQDTTTGFLSQKATNDRFLFQMATLIPHCQRLCELKLVDMAPIQNMTTKMTNDSIAVVDANAKGDSTNDSKEEDDDNLIKEKQDNKEAVEGVVQKNSETHSFWWQVDSNQALLVEALDRNTSLQAFDFQVRDHDILTVTNWKRVEKFLQRNQELKRIGDGFDDVFEASL